MDKEKGYIGRDSATKDKRSNLAAGSASATARKREDGKRKPTEEELSAFAQDLDRNMVENARKNFRKGLIASVLVVVIVVALILIAKAFVVTPYLAESASVVGG